MMRVSSPSRQPQHRANAAAPGSPIKRSSSSLYVTNIDAPVTKAQLRDLFAQYGKILSVYICRDPSTKVSLGYGYVNYSSPNDATKAMKSLNSKPLNGKPIRVMLLSDEYSCSLRGRGGPNVLWIKNFPRIEIEDIHDLFSYFGTVVECELAVDREGCSRGYGYVKYVQVGDVQEAFERLNGMVVNEKEVFLEDFVPREQRSRERNRFRNYLTLYVENLTEVFYRQDLELAFSEYGRVAHAVVLFNEYQSFDRYNRGFGFVCFENVNDAVSAIQGLNGKPASEVKRQNPERIYPADEIWHVEWAKSMYKRRGVNLYITNFSDSISNDERLKELFPEFGTITSCKLMLDSRGRSRGCGFVAFATSAHATKAMKEMNGRMIDGMPLHVSMARSCKNSASKYRRWIKYP